MERNYQTAFEYYQKAAERQLPEAIGKLGDMYANGWGVEQNNITAFKYYKQAIELVCIPTACRPTSPILNAISSTVSLSHHLDHRAINTHSPNWEFAIITDGV
jgi:Sel1 repeat